MDKVPETLICSDWRQQPLAVKYPFGYNYSMFTVFRTDEFDEWLSKLRDTKGLRLFRQHSRSRLW
jgi:hypothetical protein